MSVFSDLKVVWKLLNWIKSIREERLNMPQTPAKPWYSSLTIWGNAAMALLTAFTPELTQFVANNPKVAVVIATITNILLRFKSDKPVA